MFDRESARFPDNGDHIKSYFFVNMKIADIGIRGMNKSSDLECTDRFLRVFKCCRRAGFYFNNDQKVFILGNNIQLFSPASPVSVANSISFLL